MDIAETLDKEQFLQDLQTGHEQVTDDLSQLLDLDFQRKVQRFKEEYHSKTQEYGDFFNEEETIQIEEFIHAWPEGDVHEFYKQMDMKFHELERLILYAKQFSCDTKIYDEWDVFGNWEEYKELIQRKKRSVYILDFSQCDFVEWPDEQLIKSFEMISSKQKGLDICDTLIGVRGEKILGKLISILPYELKYLNIGNTALGQLSDDFFQYMSSKFPLWIEVLDVSANNLGRFNTEIMQKFILYLPDGLKSLDLGETRLHRYTLDELKLIFQGLPKYLKKLNLTGNELSQYSKEELGIRDDIEVEWEEG